MSDFNDNVVVLLILELSIRIYLTIIILNLPRLWSVYIVRLLSVSTARSSLLTAPRSESDYATNSAVPRVR